MYTRLIKSRDPGGVKARQKIVDCRGVEVTSAYKVTKFFDVVHHKSSVPFGGDVIHCGRGIKYLYTTSLADLSSRSNSQMGSGRLP